MAEKEIEDLKKQLKEARAREENERREKEEAKAREENERREKEKERREKEKERREKETERRKNQKTTLAEYLYNCHFDLYQKLRLAGPSESSTGLATSVDGKYYPRWLRPWHAFTDSQRREHFDDIIRICGEKRLFQQESTTRDNGINFERKKAGYENAIDHFEKTAVEDPTWMILEPVWADRGLRQKYQTTDLTFINGIRNFKDLNEDIGAETKTGRGKQQPDGGGIRTGIDENESPAFMYDYKAAHKFAVEDLDAALEKETLFMDVYEWAQTDQYKTDSTLRTKEREAARIAMALIQVFNYMLWYGVGYGYVAAGKSLVLLYYDRAEPLVLRWHLCVPDKMVIRPTAELHVEQVSQTAVAQLASFCLLSLRSQALTGRPLKKAMNQAEGILKKWKREAYTDPVTPQESDGTDSSSSMPSRGTDKSFACDDSPVARKYPLRSCKGSTAPLKSRDEDEEGGAEGYQRQRGAGASVNKGEKDSSRKSKDKGTGGSAPAPTKQYCTQACLLGLKLGRELDSRCPNVLYHGVGGNTRHPIDAQELTKLMSEQLRQDPYGSCDALIGRRKYGSSGVLFKLELARFGYTFVGKGTVSARPRRLEHECSIYQRLEKLQGDVVPVHLGMVSFRPGYLLPGGAYVIHMMLMSWAGVAMDTTLSNLEWEVQRSIQTIYENGVNHQDEREPNLLWNAERCRVMVIDFDQATVLPPPKHKRLSQLSKAGRKRKGDEFNYNSTKRGVPGVLRRSVQSVQ
ncbi:metalloprotease-like protein [Beauveria bassiana ARSEF 2860]|uniref:Metalloprotease-like protein n=1 Tax=Beauveria bassiana (strain ARSEF 2860) TaxID=655819 RepID=J4UF47_BEAB2|nr:metalloprotease-like protein [Beauveria bassiana ARSEF 2860]EJP61042.1 metalloprotease-like protein [Beauveria bassiana ARSEF 2860]